MLYKLVIRLLSVLFVPSWVDKFEEEVFYREYAETMLYWHKRADFTERIKTKMGPITPFAQPLSWWIWCYRWSFVFAMRWWKQEGRWECRVPKPIGIWVDPADVEHGDPLAWLAEGKDPYAGLTNHCWACTVRESYFQAMSLDEMGQAPDWAEGILKEYADKDFPPCEHHPAPKPISLEDEHRLEAYHGSL